MIGGKMLSVANRLGMLKSGSEGKAERKSDMEHDRKNSGKPMRSVGGAMGLSSRLM
jgi:hypothetical protein